MKYFNNINEEHIKKYIKGEISLREMAELENESIQVVNWRVQKYCKENNIKNKTILLQMKIDEYIKLFEAHKITVKQIAQSENASETIVNKMINLYYEQNGRKRPKAIRKKRYNIDIEKYITLYEQGIITFSEIAKKEHVSYSTVKSRMKEYYATKGKEIPRIGISIDILSNYLDLGMTKEQIRKEGAKRNIIIPDILFDEAIEQKNISKEKAINGSKVIETSNDIVNIEKYIDDYEKGLTISQIAKLENVYEETARYRIKKYYEKRGKKMPKVGVSITALRGCLKMGMTKDQIRKEAAKRNIIIPDIFFDRAIETNKDEKVK